MGAGLLTHTPSGSPSFSVFYLCESENLRLVLQLGTHVPPSRPHCHPAGLGRPDISGLVRYVCVRVCVSTHTGISVGQTCLQR